MAARHGVRAAGAAAILSVIAMPIHASEPLWEAGIGVAALSLPDYRGSDQSRLYAFPLPYFVYRGELLKADRQGLRGIFFKTDRVDLNMSVGASLPVDSSRNDARNAMPDLKPSVQIGPSLDATLWRSADRRMKFDLRLPVRGAITVASHPSYVGMQFYPHLNLDVRDPGDSRGWNLGLQAGPVITDARNNRYFYSVPPEFATAQRRAYEPGGGYGGTQFVAAVSKRFPKFWAGAFVRYDTLRGAVFQDSPLVTSNRYVAGGFGISWVIGESSRRVEVDELGERTR